MSTVVAVVDGWRTCTRTGRTKAKADAIISEPIRDNSSLYLVRRREAARQGLCSSCIAASAAVCIYRWYNHRDRRVVLLLLYHTGMCEHVSCHRKITGTFIDRVVQIIAARFCWQPHEKNSPNDLVARIFRPAGCSRLRARTHFLVGSTYGRIPDPTPNPNPNLNPNPNRDPKRAKNGRETRLRRFSIFQNYYSDLRTTTQPSANEKA